MNLPHATLRPPFFVALMCGKDGGVFLFLLDEPLVAGLERGGDLPLGIVLLRVLSPCLLLSTCLVGSLEKNAFSLASYICRNHVAQGAGSATSKNSAVKDGHEKLASPCSAMALWTKAMNLCMKDKSSYFRGKHVCKALDVAKATQIF